MVERLQAEVALDGSGVGAGELWQDAADIRDKNRGVGTAASAILLGRLDSETAVVVVVQVARLINAKEHAAACRIYGRAVELRLARDSVTILRVEKLTAADCAAARECGDVIRESVRHGLPERHSLRLESIRKLLQLLCVVRTDDAARKRRICRTVVECVRRSLVWQSCRRCGWLERRERRCGVSPRLFVVAR